MRLVLVLLVLWPHLVFAWPAVILNVYDGDTITVAPLGDEANPLFVRLYGIDAPDLKQQGGDAARAALLEQLPEKAQVEIIPMGLDGYGRVIGLCGRNGKIVNAFMLEQGHAWVFEKQCLAMVCRTWKGLEKKAKEAKRGLWQRKDPTAPWLWGNGIVPLKPTPSQGSKPLPPGTQMLPPLDALPVPAPDPNAWFQMDPP